MKQNKKQKQNKTKQKIGKPLMAVLMDCINVDLFLYRPIKKESLSGAQRTFKQSDCRNGRSKIRLLLVLLQ